MFAYWPHPPSLPPSTPARQAGAPAPFTPGSDPTAAAAATHQPAQLQQAAAAELALPQAAVLADDILAFDFGAAAEGVLEGHKERTEESAALSVPMADAVQEQLLVLDQVGLSPSGTE